MKQKRIWVVLVTAVFVFLVGFAIQHFAPRPIHPHHESAWWLAYYGCWLVFAGWMFMQPPAPSKGIALYRWPIWARVVWGILSAIALGRFVRWLA
jgi:hypothetical protein